MSDHKIFVLSCEGDEDPVVTVKIIVAENDTEGNIKQRMWNAYRTWLAEKGLAAPLAKEVCRLTFLERTTPTDAWRHGSLLFPTSEDAERRQAEMEKSNLFAAFRITPA